MALRISTLAVVTALAFGGGVSSAAAAPQAWLLDWASQREMELALERDPDPVAPGRMNDPVPLTLTTAPIRPLTEAEAARNARTIAAYGAAIGENSPAALLWTGVETANPLTRDEGYRWNALRDQGLFDAERRQTIATALISLGVANVRLGLSNHEIDLDEPSSWAEHDAMIADLAGQGLNLSLDLHHFGIEDRFRVVDEDGRTVNEESYYLHPDWPDYFARFAAAAYARYSGAIKLVTIVNEPETTVGFNSEMWNGAFPGWGDPRHDRFYVERAFAIATAAVRARIAIEAQNAEGPKRALFMHTEGAVYKPGRTEFNRFTRFLPSDLILGQNWLLDADLDVLAATPVAALALRDRAKPQASRTSLDWLIATYVLKSSGDERELRLARLVQMLETLMSAHAALKADFGLTMRDDTIFAADYYAQNEDFSPSGAWLNPEPQFYAAQVAAGERRGLYELVADYYNRYGLPMMIGETGTPFYAYGARWHGQMLLEVARAIEDGIPMLGYAVYPLIDTFGWESALSVPKAQTVVNPAGIVTIDLEARDFMRTLMSTLDNRVAGATRGAAETVR
ncbi:hypothetical protein ACFQI3_04690 [Hansschlegelia quercus]|uniref:Glycoside hydrolase family 1 protein n=1 Tax=Hansschlegelia quercus TaxID=2528245 RepID=A0A4Q9GLG7_9HYPH|nr:hypothetical protein [Hansschlegelia quercus]TBN55173.1 hypothetical protein EYR15_03285 [Hansschlegelia quercus]